MRPKPGNKANADPGFSFCRVCSRGNSLCAALAVANGQFATMQKSTRQRLLELVVARLGRGRVAIRLAVPLAILDDWSSGTTAMPDAKLVQLINLIEDTSDDQAALEAPRK